MLLGLRTVVSGETVMTSVVITSAAASMAFLLTQDLDENRSSGPLKPHGMHQGRAPGARVSGDASRNRSADRWIEPQCRAAGLPSIPYLDDLLSFDGRFALGLCTPGFLRGSGGSALSFLCSAVRAHERAGSRGFVFERQSHPGPKRRTLPVFNLHIHLHDLGDAQITN